MKKILIVKPSSLGDIVYTLPTLAGLRKLYPDAYIAWLIFEHFSDILTGNSDLDEIICWKKNSLNDFFNVLKKIRDARFDLLIDMQGLARSSLVALFSNAKQKLGYPGMREFSYLFTREIAKYDPKMHTVERNLKVVKYLGGATEDKKFFINIDEEIKKFVREFLRFNNVSENDTLIGICPSAGIWQKKWPYFGELSKMIVNQFNSKVIFFGSKDDLPSINKIIQKNGDNRLINSAGKTTLRQLAGLIKTCKLVISNDTGPLHIASALNIPVIGLYGPSDPSLVGPYGSNKIVLWKGLECSPCGVNSRCLDNKCMKCITIDEVLQGVEKLI